jgi:hypothetical protein
VTDKQLAKRQQKAVDNLATAFQLVGGTVDRVPSAAREDSHFAPELQFAEGQLNAHLWTAYEALKAAIECFGDCAEEGVKVPNVSP